MIKDDEINNENSCLNKARGYEGIFVLRAKDPAAPAAILAWIKARIQLDLNQAGDAKLIEAENCALLMDMQRNYHNF